MARTSPILIESRTEFAVGSLIFILRWLTRWRTAGLSQWYVDDWFSISAWVSYAVLIAMVEFLGMLTHVVEPGSSMNSGGLTMKFSQKRSCSGLLPGSARIAAPSHCCCFHRRWKGNVCLFLYVYLFGLESESNVAWVLSTLYVSGSRRKVVEVID